MSNKYSILLTIDVEDWFQVENFKGCIPFSSWSSCELRVEANTHRLLDLLDSQQSAVRGQRSGASLQLSAMPAPPALLGRMTVSGWNEKHIPLGSYQLPAIL